MPGYDSQEEVIYAWGHKHGIDRDVIWEYFDKAIDRVTTHHPGRSPDWRLEKAERGVWNKFFPQEQFPGDVDKAAAAKSALRIAFQGSNDSSHTDNHSPQKSSPLKMEFDSNVLQPTQRSGNAQVKVESFSSPDADLPTYLKTQRVGYASQYRLIISKAAGRGVDLSELKKIMGEKQGIAEARYSGESEDWQTWLAESMAWRFYFKDSPFPGIEPERLYSLRSTNMEDSHKRVKGDSSGNRRWEKFSDLSKSSPTKVNNLLPDLYRPNTSSSPPLRMILDRAIPQKVDSYRPSTSSIPTGPRSEGPNRSAVSMSDSAPLARSSTSSNAVLIRQTTGSDSAPRKNYYFMQEKVMEEKAMHKGIRKEFFQYLQRKRDDVRAQHPDCSSEAKHYAADTATWAKFFTEPFPVPPPSGAGLHGPRCRVSPSIIPIRSTPFPQLCTRASALPEFLRPSERLPASHASTRGPVPSEILRSTERSASHASTRVASTRSESLIPSERLSTPTQSHPPRELVIELNSKRLTTKSTSETRALMINKQITWTTASTVKKIYDSFSAIDSDLMDAVENELKCHFRNYLMTTGDLVLWNEAFLTDDQFAYDRGSKFLNGWYEFASKIEKEPFLGYWKQFKDLENVDSGSSPSGGSPLVLVDNKFIKCSMEKSQKLLHLFYYDKGRKALEDSLACKFSYSFRAPDQKIVEFRVQSNDRMSDSYRDTNKRLSHTLHCWIDRVLDPDRTGRSPSLSEYWRESGMLQSRDCRFGRICIQGVILGTGHNKLLTEIILPTSISVVHQIYGVPEKGCESASRNDWAQAMTDFEMKLGVSFSFKLRSEDIDGLETLMFIVESRDEKDSEIVRLGVFLIQTWALKAFLNPAYTLEEHIANSEPGAALMPHIPHRNAQAKESDWARYATTFKASDLDRLMIEEAAKSEGSLRMVLDEASGQVIGLDEYSKRVMDRAANAILTSFREVEQSDIHVSDTAAKLDSSPSKNVKESGKRKLEDGDAEDAQTEKKARV